MLGSIVNNKLPVECFNMTFNSDPLWNRYNTFFNQKIMKKIEEFYLMGYNAVQQETSMKVCKQNRL
jgi:hypothetical protein